MGPRISIITLGVKDLKTATKFYKKGLGFPLKKGFSEISFFTLKGTWLSLYPIDKLTEDAKVKKGREGKYSGLTLAHNVRTKKEVDRLIKKAEQAGAIVTDPPHDRFWGGYSGYFKDLDGYLWEVAFNPDFKIG